jgi:hypothetical protein
MQYDDFELAVLREGELMPSVDSVARPAKIAQRARAVLDDGEHDCAP